MDGMNPGSYLMNVVYFDQGSCTVPPNAGQNKLKIN